VTDGIKPLPGERGVRFGCGAIAGALFGFFIAVRETGGDVRLAAFIAVGSAVGLGWLAAVLGDRLWQGLSKVLWWIR
jgi:hypothetical protein